MRGNFKGSVPSRYGSFESRNPAGYGDMVHPVDKPFQCPECSRIFDSPEFLGRHIVNVHTPTSTNAQHPRKCRRGCGRVFETKYVMDLDEARWHEKLCEGVTGGEVPSPV